jgi:hypothetical protein
MPRQKRRINRTVKEDLVELKVLFEELTEEVEIWEAGVNDPESWREHANRLQQLLLLLPRDLLQVAMKVARLKEARMVSPEGEERRRHHETDDGR